MNIKNVICMFMLILSVCLFRVNVYAEDIFGFDFRTNVKDFYWEEFRWNPPVRSSSQSAIKRISDNEGRSVNGLISYRNGYLELSIIGSENKNGTELVYYDYKWNILKRNFIENYFVVSPVWCTSPTDFVFIDVEDIYLFAIYAVYDSRERSSYYNIQPYMLKIDSNFEIQNKVEDVSPVALMNNKLYAVSYKKDFIEYNLGLEEIKRIDVEDNVEYYDELAHIRDAYRVVWNENLSPKNIMWLIEENYDDWQIFFRENGETNNPFIKNFFDMVIRDINEKYVLYDDYDKIKILDRSGKEVFSKSIDSDEVIDVRLIHDYVALIKNIDEVSSEEFYDFNGNLVQTLKKENPLKLPNTESSDDFYTNIVETDLGFSVFSWIVPTIPFMATQSYYYSSFYTYLSGLSYSEVYSMAQPINVNIMGSGSVRVDSKAKSGDRVILEVDIPEGQMLKSLRVYDEKNNLIEVEKNSFIMPASPVRIEAEFVPALKENPKTGLMSFTGLVIAIVGVGVSLYFVKNKNRFTILERI